MAGGEHGQGAVAVLRGDDGDHANAHVEGLLHLRQGDLAHGSDGAEDLGRGPGRAVDLSGEALRDDALEVARETAAGDVAERGDLALGGERQAVQRVDLGRLEEFLAEGAAELFHVAVERQASLVKQDVAGQRVAVGVQSRRTHGDEHVAIADLVRAEEAISLDDAHGRGGNVVLFRVHDAGVLRGLAAEQSAACLDAAFGNALDDLGDLLRNDLAHRNVVLEEQRLGAADHEVIDAHGDQVDADGVVLVHRLGDGELRAHAVRTSSENGLLVLAQLEQTGKTAEAAHDLRAGGALGVRGEEGNGAVALFDAHAGSGIRGAGVLGGGLRGSGGVFRHRGGIP